MMRLAIAAVVFLAIPAVGLSDTVWVDDDYTSSTPGWGVTHFDKIEDGINAVGFPGLVLVAEGTYIENVFCQVNGVTIRSDVDGLESTYDISPTTTIIDGNQADTVVRFRYNVTPLTVLDGFTIKNGFDSTQGGGIYCYETSPTIKNNIITLNDGGSYGGGGIRCLTSNAQIIDNTISNNTGSKGGGILCSGCYSILIQGNTITENTTWGTDWYTGGGGIYMYSCSNQGSVIGNYIHGNTSDGSGGGIMCHNEANTKIEANQIYGNTSQQYGGGLFIYDHSHPNVIDNDIYTNSSEYRGGGIGCYNSSPSISDNRIYDNDAIQLGGGVFCIGDENTPIIIKDNQIYGNEVTVPNCWGGGICCIACIVTISTNTVTNNVSAGGGGGGIYLQEVSGEVASNIIAENQNGSVTNGGWGGGIYCWQVADEEVQLVNNTIAYNYASTDAGGVGVNFPTVNVHNNIIWGNVAPVGPQIIFYNITDPMIYHCCVENGTGEPWFDSTCIDPLGGPHFVDDSPPGNYHIYEDSPCIDVGDNSVVPAWLTEDIDGEDRIQNGTVDMGADEGGTSTLVELLSLTATGADVRVAVEWKTASEIDNAGFHIWRCATGNKEEGEWIRVTDQLIPSQGGPTWGAEYIFVDRGVDPNHTYMYRLADVSFSGTSTLYKPVLTRWKD